MTDTASATPSPYSDEALLIVELLERIGSHLTLPDLLACVQVSRHWNSVLIPCLWHTIDDSLYSWSDIIAVHIDNNAPRLSRIIKAEREAEQAASNSNSGTDGPPMDEEKALGQREPTADWQGFWQCIDDDEQEARLWSTGLHLADDDVPTWLYWAAARRFWILVLRNPTIEYLRLSRSLCTISPLVSEEFVYHVLATLPRLKCLDSHFMALDLQTVLECTSTTHSGNSNRGLFYHDNKPRSLRLDRDFAHMTSLAVRGGFVKPTDILMLLKRLVNLNQLTVGKINLDDGTQQLFVDTDDNYEERTRKFPLSGLHLVDFSEVTDGFMAVREAITKRLIPRLPFLTEISDEVLMPEMIVMDRMTPDDCRAMSLEQGDSNRSIAEEKYRRCQERHSRVYERLARLTHLQTLDLGGDIQDWRNQFYEETPVIELNGRMFLFLSTPIMDGLELSLASGLVHKHDKKCQSPDLILSCMATVHRF
ncbi:MAG: hypothetical protein J3R72DRAFT_428345 [Linnemannia gamsii]|nr:MAG: hypothetical protein J3R72DRAFT_428345 [Linnemannia gamsii]